MEALQINTNYGRQILNIFKFLSVEMSWLLVA